MKLSAIKFKAGSYITVENKQEGHHFYIVRRGAIKTFSSFRQADRLQRVLGPGDFFGVISAMTGHPRLISSQVVTDSEVIMVRKDQFDFLIQQSPPLVLKIIRSFSNELRKYSEELASRTLLATKKKDDPYMLFHQGEFYYNKGEMAISAYIYTQYIKNFAYSDLAKEAQERLKTIDLTVLSKIKHAFASDLNRKYKQGDILFSEFEPGFEVFIIESGRVNISKVINGQEVLIAVLKQGDIFGEMALLNNENRSATAIAAEPTSCTVLNQRNFNNIINKNARLATKIIMLLSERLWTIYKQLDNFYFKDIKHRIYDTLITQVYKKHVHNLTSASYAFDFGPKEIQSMLGVEERLVKDALRVILQEDIVTIDKNKFLCRNLSRLEKEVEFGRKMEQRRRRIEISREKHHQ
ncbi:hypothetical protein COTS27_01517 [Spirochaetota bacterium]|nr:hypothetical protein COTS27_01517 [Spirochaetota bacterium]